MELVKEKQNNVGLGAYRAFHACYFDGERLSKKVDIFKPSYIILASFRQF